MFFISQQLDNRAFRWGGNPLEACLNKERTEYYLNTTLLLPPHGNMKVFFTSSSTVSLRSLNASVLHTSHSLIQLTAWTTSRTQFQHCIALLLWWNTKMSRVYIARHSRSRPKIWVMKCALECQWTRTTVLLSKTMHQRWCCKTNRRSCNSTAAAAASLEVFNPRRHYSLTRSDASHPKACRVCLLYRARPTHLSLYKSSSSNIITLDKASINCT